MPKTDAYLVRYSTGRGRNLSKTKERALPRPQFIDQFREPQRTAERMRDYDRMSEDEQKVLKAVAGWFFRAQTEGGVRNAKSARPSDILTFDFDYPSVEFFERMCRREIMPGLRWFLHTSRRHRDGKPRFRLFVFLERPVPNDLYMPVSRIVAQMFDPDMEFVDRVSFRPAQLMFMPTASKDQEYVFVENDGEDLDWEDALDTFQLVKGDWRDVSNLPKTEGERLRVTADKMEDPTEKTGPVGDFCRAFNIFEAIEHFDLPYDEADGSWSKPRFTYRGGTTTNGVEVHEEGLFLTSYHGSDPVGDMTVNAFDLVRIHLFGELDEDKHQDLPITQRPSWTNMIARIQEEPRYKEQVLLSRYDLKAMNEDFDDEGAGFDEESKVEIIDDDEEISALVGPAKNGKAHEAAKSEIMVSATANDAVGRITIKRAKKPKPDDKWMGSLQLTKDGVIIANLPNVAKVIQNDLRMREAVAYNGFVERVVALTPIRSKMSFIPDLKVHDPINGDTWEDIHTTALRGIVESENGPGLGGYGFKVADRDIDGAIELSARTNTIHPAREYFDSLTPGPRARAEGLLIDYFGVANTPYHRECAWKLLVACIARIYEPGHKFDQVPVFISPQGWRKSTFIEILSRGWFGELSANFDEPAKLVEQMLGCMMMEIAEVSNITRSRTEDAKAFLSARATTVRLAWARRVKTFKRQCVFVGSTNDDQFLQDDTGNRRFWPIYLQKPADTDKLLAEIDLIWASALGIYRAMREKQPHGDLPLALGPDAIKEALRYQERARLLNETDKFVEKLAEWADRKIDPGDELGPVNEGFNEVKEYRHRTRICIAEARDAMDLPVRGGDRRESNHIGKALRKLGFAPREEETTQRHWKYGKVEFFYPTKELLDRWAEEDGEIPADDTGLDLV
jgi:putative DNA primase/helicase